MKFRHRLAALAAAQRLARGDLEVEAEAGEVVGQRALVLHPAAPSAGPSSIVSVRSARDTRRRAAFWLQPSRRDTSS